MRKGHAVTRSALRNHPNEEHCPYPGVARNAATREFWLHDSTGYVWALEIDSGDRVIAAAGPLTKRDADPLLLDYLVYKATDVAWIVRRRGEFTRAHV